MFGSRDEFPLSKRMFSLVFFLFSIKRLSSLILMTLFHNSLSFIMSINVNHCIYSFDLIEMKWRKKKKQKEENSLKERIGYLSQQLNSMKSIYHKKMCTRFSVCWHCSLNLIWLWLEWAFNQHCYTLSNHHTMQSTHITLCVQWSGLFFSSPHFAFFLLLFCVWHWCFVRIKVSGRRTVCDSVHNKHTKKLPRNA